MKLVCPACGATASREAWENDAAARQFDGVLISLPHAVQRQVTQYIGLFRKGDRGLAWKRALKLIREVKEMVDLRTVQWTGGESRPAPPELWAEVMEYMCGTGKKELSDHNYLRKVVWERAKGMAATTERAREEAIRRGARETEHVSEDERVSVKGLLSEFRKNPTATLEKLQQQGTK